MGTPYRNYSQGNEQPVIMDYFKEREMIPHILSIGENNGIDLSNCRRLIERGASAILIEPSPKAFKKLHDLYFDEVGDVWCFNVAIGDFDGQGFLFESGEHLGNGDVGLLSTLKEAELKRWENSNTQFEETETLVWTFKTLQKEVEKIGRSTKYQFISIDAEGFDLNILKQIDLKEVDCQCICIEHNSDGITKAQMGSYCYDFGLKNVLLINAENIILAR